MATLKRLTRRPRGESLRGSFMIDTVRGVLRVRRWPKKRGTPKSAKQRWWNDWFKQANYLAKYVDGATAARAIEITAGSGMYPRDIIISAMRGRLYRWVDQNGKVWNSMAAVQDISDSLDVLAQAIGSVLIRANDRWRAITGGSVGDVLTNQGPDVVPVWAPAAAGGLSVSQLDYAAAPAGAFASQGWQLDIAVPVTIYGFNNRLQGAAGLTGFFGVYRLTAGTYTIAEIIATTPAIAGPAAGVAYHYQAATAPIALVAGVRYAVMWTRTDGGGATNSLIVRTANRIAALPANGGEARVELASTAPAVANALTASASPPYTLNLLYRA